MLDWSLNYTLIGVPHTEKAGVKSIKIGDDSYAVAHQSRIPINYAAGLAVVSGGGVAKTITLIDPLKLEKTVHSLILFLHAIQQLHESPYMILLRVAEFVSSRLRMTSQHTLDAFAQNATQSGSFVQQQGIAEVPCIPLSTLVEGGVGGCRNHGLLTAYLIAALIDKGMLPPGQAYYHRQYFNKEKTRLHGWSIYVAQGERPQIFSIDSSRYIRHQYLAVSEVLNESGFLESLYHPQKYPITRFIYSLYTPSLTPQFNRVRDAQRASAAASQLPNDREHAQPKGGLRQ